ncbi:MAG: hypothetical protein ABJI69_01745 [Balneola sp.]
MAFRSGATEPDKNYGTNTTYRIVTYEVTILRLSGGDLLWHGKETRTKVIWE